MESCNSSLKCCFFGWFPDKDQNEEYWPPNSQESKYAKTEFCDGQYFLVCWGLAADLDYHANSFKIPHFNANEACCNYCPANRTVHLITDVSTNASWKPLVFNVLMIDKLFPSDHVIWTLVGVRRWHIMLDLMHSGDLGVLVYFLGGVLVELLLWGPYSGVQASRLGQLWADIQEVYDNNPALRENRLNRLEVSMFYTPGEFGLFKGKAAESRHFLPVLMEVCKKHDNNSTWHRMRLLAGSSLMDMYDVIMAGGLFLSKDESLRVCKAYDRFLLAYNWLVNYHVRRSEMVYNLAATFHVMWHIAQMSKWINPRAVWCYGFESFMSLVKRSAVACLAGTSLQGIGQKLLYNFLFVLHLRDRHDEDL